MKASARLLIATTALLAATPVMACDMHGGGMFWTPSQSWQNFTPKASLIDPVYLDEDDSFSIDTKKLTAPKPKARPSFSNAADRASQSAKRRVMNAPTFAARSSKTDGSKVKASASSDAKDAELDPNAQAIR